MEEYSRDQAIKDFEEWYERCLENGIYPEDVVADMGEMRLITFEEEE